RFGCSKTKGIPRTPSQKSIDVCRSAPTIVMWWTPWLCSFRMSSRDPTLLLHELRLPLASPERPPRDELDARLDDQYVADARADRLRECVPGTRVARELDADR